MWKIWKRLWIPTASLVLLIISCIVSSKATNEDVSNGFAVLILIFFLLFTITFVWSIVKSLRQSIRIKNGQEPMPVDGEGPVRRIFAAFFGYIKNQISSYKLLNSALKKRFWIFKLLGYGLSFFAVYLIVCFYDNNGMIITATLVLIGGAAFAISASPVSFNSGSDIVKLIPLDSPKPIEEIFEDFKNLKTPLGSPYLATMKLSKQPKMIFGPDSDGFYIYCYLNRSNQLFYIGDTFINTIDEVIAESTNPYDAKDNDSLSMNDLVCLSSSILLLKYNLYEMFKEYFKTGTVTPLEEYNKATVYTFDERFKLWGQKFDLYDTNENKILHIEGTVPLVSLKITDPYDNTELFKVVKQIDQLLTTYNIYKEGNFYGTLKKDPTLYKDKFSMDTEDGRIELTENAGYIGTNYTVRLNGKIIGTIMDNLELTLRNLVFDNSIVFVYDNRYKELIAAMAVMVAREIARDRDNKIPDREE